MLNLETFATRDGYGDYMWDRVLWLLAPGACVFLAVFAFGLKYFTPPPNAGGRPQQRISMPAVHGGGGHDTAPDHGAAPTGEEPHGDHDGHAH